MDALVAFMSKSIVSVGIIYAWTYSYNRPSKFRGGGAQNMKEEFSAYDFFGIGLTFLILDFSRALLV